MKKKVVMLLTAVATCATLMTACGNTEDALAGDTAVEAPAEGADTETPAEDNTNADEGAEAPVDDANAGAEAPDDDANAGAGTETPADDANAEAGTETPADDANAETGAEAPTENADAAADTAADAETTAE